MFGLLLELPLWKEQINKQATNLRKTIFKWVTLKSIKFWKPTHLIKPTKNKKWFLLTVHKKYAFIVYVIT